MKENDPSLSGKEIDELVQAKLKAYENLSVLEKYAMFIGRAQILEFGLKGLLTRKYGIPSEKMEKWTLGYVKNKLEQRGLRPDFIAFLKSVVEYRNYFAHEFLVNTAITKSIANFSDRKLYGDLYKAIYELERIIILYDWCEKYNGWQTLQKLNVITDLLGKKLHRLDIYNEGKLIGEYERSQGNDIERKIREIYLATDLLLTIHQKHGIFRVRWDGKNKKKSIRVDGVEVATIPKKFWQKPSWK
jgi:hypothetical protein